MVVLVAVVLSAIAVIILGGIYAHLKMIYSQLRLYEDYYEKKIAELKVKLDSAVWDSDFNLKCLEEAEAALRWKEEIIEGLKEKFYEEYGESPEEEWVDCDIDTLGETKKVWEDFAETMSNLKF